MGTLKQKKLAKAIIANAKAKNPKNMKELLVSAGYDETTADATPGRTFKQIGLQKELAKYGFHEDGAKAVVEEILYDRTVAPSDRLKASDQVFKVRGAYAPEKQAIVHAYIIPDEDKKRIDDILNDNNE